MLANTKQRGLNPEAVIADSGYSSLDDLKCVRDLGWKWVMGLKKNRKVNRNGVISTLLIPDTGLKLHLRGVRLDLCIQVCG